MSEQNGHSGLGTNLPPTPPATRRLWLPVLLGLASALVVIAGAVIVFLFVKPGAHATLTTGASTAQSTTSSGSTPTTTALPTTNGSPLFTPQALSGLLAAPSIQTVLRTPVDPTPVTDAAGAVHWQKPSDRSPFVTLKGGYMNDLAKRLDAAMSDKPGQHKLPWQGVDDAWLLDEQTDQHAAGSSDNWTVLWRHGDVQLNLNIQGPPIDSSGPIMLATLVDNNYRRQSGLATH